MSMAGSAHQELDCCASNAARCRDLKSSSTLQTAVEDIARARLFSVRAVLGLHCPAQQALECVRISEDTDFLAKHIPVSPEKKVSETALHGEVCVTSMRFAERIAEM